MSAPASSAYSAKFFDAQAAGSLTSARIILGALFGAIPVASVVDVGCGIGTWLRAALDLGAARVLGLDGAYVDRDRLMVEPTNFRACDLTADNVTEVIPADTPGLDLIVSVEVAEHLPSSRAPSCVAVLCELGDLILFSAAVPGQGGTDHVNEQWPAYWARLFDGAGFTCFDALRPLLWNEPACEWWYLQNVLLFARRETQVCERLAGLWPHAAAQPRSLVHPRMHEHAIMHFSEHVRELKGLREQVVYFRELAAAHANTIEMIRASTSWRITGPARSLAARLRR